MLEFADKPFNQVSLPVQIRVNLALKFAIGARRNDQTGVLLQNCFQKPRTIISFVGNQRLELETGDQIFRFGRVIALAAGQNKANGFPKRVHRQMNLGREPAARAT